MTPLIARLDKVDAWQLLVAAWVVALLSTLGALFIGEVMGQVPCNLCWFQRAFMFPLAVVLGVAALLDDRGVWRYALPLAAIGQLIALYHLLLYVGVIPPALEPCGEGSSCSSANMRIFGRIPIPFLSVASFAAIAAFLLQLRKATSP
ncbi:MAG: disulfide bond formation protein B [Hyphomicrobiaceae bacterium]